MGEDDWMIGHYLGDCTTESTRTRRRDRTRRAIDRVGQSWTTTDGNREDEMGEVALTNQYDRAKAELLKALGEFAGLQALLDRFQGQEPPVGTVLRWVKVYNEPQGDLVLDPGSGLADSGRIRFNIEGGQEYHFVAFRAPNGKWYTTSQRGRDVNDWSDLLKRIGDAPCWLVSDWVEVPVPEKPNMDAVDPVEFARQMFGKKVPVVDADEKSS